jgi:hypothetical protein
MYLFDDAKQGWNENIAARLVWRVSWNVRTKLGQI